MNDFWNMAQWWTYKPETKLGFEGKVSIVIVNVVLFVFVLTAFLIR